ncbi:hypothetical protein GCM10007857_23770 [Bradyrhizobium iriomotense]|uniref:Uncharacterized protein n=1 Tax=Bradyrhizobium iriomotense TaxID=441950 RepID=A0ABQ6AWQ6_9BRAD|nr:hypothetical protein GCM10007857_23770 [Bradyrhizobium iriomotense]
MAHTQDRDRDSAEAAAGKSQTVQDKRGCPPKILKKRVFVRIGEFHSGSKRATGGTEGMREAGAGAKGMLNIRTSASSSADTAAEA